MRRRLLFALVASGAIACSGILGLTDPKEFPSDAGSGSEASASSSSGGLDGTSHEDAGPPCGRDCGRGKCEGNVCQPFTLATLNRTTSPAVTAMAHDDLYLYVVVDYFIYRVAKSSGEITKLAHPRVVRIARNGPKLYWSTDDAKTTDDLPVGSIRACELPECPRNSLVASIGSAAGLTAASGFGGHEPIAWVDNWRGSVWVPSVNQAAPTKLAEADGRDRMFIHLQGEGLYWTDTDRTFHRLNRGETAPKAWDAAPYQVADFAVVGDDVIFHWTASSGGALARARLGASTFEDVKDMIAIPEPNAQLVIDGDALFVMSGDALRTCKLPACSSLTVHTSAPAGVALRAVEVDGDALWFTLADGRVMGVAR